MALVRCGKCANEYDVERRIPKVTPCGHTFCLVCLNAAKRETVVTCPSCNQIHYADPAGFPTVYDLANQRVDAAGQPAPAPNIIPDVPAPRDGRIHIRPPNGPSFMMRVSLDENVLSLKSKINVRIGIEPQFQSLLFGDQVLEDRRTLASYNIHIDATIEMTIRVVGGSI